MTHGDKIEGKWKLTIMRPEAFYGHIHPNCTGEVFFPDRKQQVNTTQGMKLDANYTFNYFCSAAVKFFFHNWCMGGVLQVFVVCVCCVVWV